jgi:hypothetical protein
MIIRQTDVEEKIKVSPRPNNPNIADTDALHRVFPRVGLRFRDPQGVANSSTEENTSICIPSALRLLVYVGTNLRRVRFRGVEG